MNRHDLRTRTRQILAAPALLTCALALAACSPARDASSFADAVAALEAKIGGHIGVYAVDLASGDSLGHRADERFATASTFKPLLAAAVLAEADAGRLSLDEAVEVHGIERQPHSPVIAEVPAGGTLTLAELCRAAITISDNTATNLLFDRVGGPAGLTAFLRRSGDAITRMDRYEVALNSNQRGDPRDTTTPRAMAKTFDRLLFGDVLSPASRQQLADWLVASETGGARLRAGLPPGWRVGDKTGSGANGAVNNVAVAWPPEGGPFVIAVYLSWTDEPVATLNTVHARIAALAVERLYGVSR